MHEITLNEDLEADESILAEKCDNCQTFRHKLLASRHENAELLLEMQKLTDKLDNIRRLQEVGMLNSFRK